MLVKMELFGQTASDTSATQHRPGDPSYPPDLNMCSQSLTGAYLPHVLVLMPVRVNGSVFAVPLLYHVLYFYYEAFTEE